MRRIVALALLLALPLAGSLSLAAAAGQADPRQELGELQSEHQEALRAFQEELRALEKKGESATAVAEFRRQWDPTPAFVEEAWERAATYAGTDQAIPFLLWIVQRDVAPETIGTPDEARSLGPRAKDALHALAEAHAASPQLGTQLRFAHEWTSRMPAARCAASLEELAAALEDEGLKAWARGSALIVRVLDEDLPEAERSAARQALDALLAASEDEELGTHFGAILFEREHLQIGKVAPDIEGQDLDGKTFKLSDYRGKVVVLDFWGDW